MLAEWFSDFADKRKKKKFSETPNVDMVVMTHHFHDSFLTQVSLSQPPNNNFILGGDQDSVISANQTKIIDTSAFQEHDMAGTIWCKPGCFF